MVLIIGQGPVRHGSSDIRMPCAQLKRRTCALHIVKFWLWSWGGRVEVEVQVLKVRYARCDVPTASKTVLHPVKVDVRFGAKQEEKKPCSE